MGCIVAKEQDVKSQKIEKVLKQDSRAQARIKLLLLGPGESGKSTVLKQIRLWNGQEFGSDEIAVAKRAIYRNIFDGCLSLAKCAKKLSRTDPSFNVDTKGFGPVICAFIESLPNSSPACLRGYRPNRDMVVLLKKLWEQPPIRIVYAEHRNSLQLPDSTEYFLSERIDDILKTDYVPTEMDIVRSRLQTTGVKEVQVTFPRNMKVKFVDVGGQKSERARWIQCFDGVTCIIYVVALIGYVRLPEDEKAFSRLHEALDIFQEVLANECFRSTSVILFLNKRDLFEAEIQTTPLTVCFPEYAGDTKDFDECTDYILHQFEERSKDPERIIYPHITCATDQNAMSLTLKSLKHILMAHTFVHIF